MHDSYLSVSVCKNQAKWKKSETCMSKPHWPDNVISLKDTFSIWKKKKTLFDLCINGFAQNFFNRILEKWGFWQSYLPLKCSFSVYFNETATQWSSVILKILSVFLDSDDVNSQITLSKWWFFFLQCFTNCLILTGTDT